MDCPPGTPSISHPCLAYFCCCCVSRFFILPLLLFSVQHCRSHAVAARGSTARPRPASRVNYWGGGRGEGCHTKTPWCPHRAGGGGTPGGAPRRRQGIARSIMHPRARCSPASAATPPFPAPPTRRAGLGRMAGSRTSRGWGRKGCFSTRIFSPSVFFSPTPTPRAASLGGAVPY